ncbi:cytochrome c biogenesis protein ResB, partial [Bacteroidota bacterium]
ESFFIAFGIVAIGFIIELLTNSSGGFGLHWPYNFIVLIAFLIYIAAVQSFWPKHPFVNWLSSTQAAIASICALTILILLMGFIPQNTSESIDSDGIGLTHIVKNWAFIFSSIMLLVVLGFTTFKRLTSFSIKNLAFFLNHFGLWLILAAGFMGSADSSTFMMQIDEGGKTAQAFNLSNNKYNMPFAIELNDFKMEEYAPKLVLYKIKGGKVDSDETELFSFEQGKKTIINNYEIEFDQYMNSAFYDSSGIVESDREGTAPAAFIIVTNTNSGFKTEDWVSCGSFMMPGLRINLDNDYHIAMNDPVAKKFSSDITVIETGKEPYNETIEVNKPFKIGTWKIYQLSYDENKGKWSKYSVFELVRDPWLIAIYIGIFMVLGGAVYLFWTGNFLRKESKNN